MLFRSASLTGFAVAALWASTPWLLASLFSRPVELSDILLSGLVGLWMASVSWRTYVYSTAKISGKVQGIETPQEVSLESVKAVEPSAAVPIRSLVRRAAKVDANQSISEALDHAATQRAGAIVVTRDNVIVGIVREAAVSTTPHDLRAVTPIVQVARRVSVDEAIPADTMLTELTSDLDNPAVQEWLVVDADGRLYGVLIKSDVWGRFDV